MRDPSPVPFIRLAVIFELSMAVVGGVLAWFFRVPILAKIDLSGPSLLLGLLAALPPAVIAPMTQFIDWEPFHDLRRLMNENLWPLLKPAGVVGFSFIAAAAGIGEEVLFRGFLQQFLSSYVGVVAAVAGSSLIFGLVHPMSVLYVAIAASIGAYLGVLFVLSDNLVVPIAAHAGYDFVVFVYWRLFLSGSRPSTRGWKHQPDDDVRAVGDNPPSASVSSSEYRSPEHREIHDSTRSGFMKAAFVNQPGPASTIIDGDLPKPTPKADELLVRIGASGVNPIDTYVRSGAVKMPIPLPYVIGSDFAGVVEAVGSNVTRFKPGDRVWGSNQGLLGRQGTAAEFAAIEECWAYPTPEKVADETVAAIALVGITAHLGLFRDAHLQRGETLFVNGGTGGVGSMVVQMAKAAGAKVITTVGSAEKEGLARNFGADVVINYKTGDIAKEVQTAAPQGVDVWWETIREPNLELSVPLMAKRGRIVLMAGRDAKPVLPLGAFYTKDCKILGFAMFNASPEDQRTCAEQMGRWLAEGKLRANISRVMPFAEAAAAHQLQEESTLHKSGALTGKIILKP